MEASTNTNVGTGPAEERAGVLARGLSVFIFAGLVAIVPLSSIPYGSVEPVWTGLFDALVFVLAALWAVEGALTGRWLTRVHALLVPCLALAAFAFVQSVSLPFVGRISFDPYESRLFALRFLAVTLYAVMLLRYASSERRLRVLAVTVVCVGVASALFGIFRQASQREALGFFLPLLRKGEGYAQFINRNHFSYLAEMALGIIAGLAAGRGVPRGKLLLCAATALPLWAALVLSNSRGGVFTMLCQLMFLAATFGATRPAARGAAAPDSAAARIAGSGAARAVLAVLLLAAVVVGTVWVGGDPLADRMETVRDEVGAERADPVRAGRADIWAATWRLVGRHPLAGVGLGGYWIAIRTTHGGSGALVPRQAHNDYLELFASAGVVGALLLLWFLILFVRRAWERLRAGTPFTRAVCLGALAGLFGVAVHSLVDFGLHVTANAFICAALVALAAAETENDGAQIGQKTSR